MTRLYQQGDVSIDGFVVGPVETNCYVLSSAGECVVIDPGAAGDQIAQACGCVPKAILATHGHGDHVGGVKALAKSAEPPIPFLVGEPDAKRAMNAGKPGNLGIPYDDDAPAPEHYLLDGDVISVGSIELRVIASPGHTPGGVVLLGPGFAFTGDTIFAGSVGRTDFPESDSVRMQESLAKLKQVVPPSTVLFPGHGPSTTMQAELDQNPYL